MSNCQWNIAVLPVERPEVPTDGQSNDRSENRAGYKFRQPMDRHRNAPADVNRVEQYQRGQQFIFRIQRDQAKRHRKRHRGVRRRPAPKNAAAHQAELKAVAGINVRGGQGFVMSAVKRRRDPARERLVKTGGQPAEQRRLPERPGRVDEPPIFPQQTRHQQQKLPQIGTTKPK